MEERGLIEERLKAWLDAQFEARIPRLIKLRKLEVRGPARGVIYQLTEWLGAMPRDQVNDLLKTLGDEGRKALAVNGVRFGTETIFVPENLKPKAQEILARLWSIYYREFPVGALPPAGRVTVPHLKGVANGFYAAIGFVRLGEQVIRADMTERLAAAVRKAAHNQPFAITPEMLSLAGVGHAQMKGILSDLGYRGAGEVDGKAVFIKRGAANGNRRGKLGREQNRKGREAVGKAKGAINNEQHAGGAVKSKHDAGSKRAVIANRGADRKPDLSNSPFAILKTMDVAH
jgi:ATP-dependent RNA helicase SUPV3L1/SUV3